MIWLKIETTRHNLQEIRKKIFSRSCSSWGCGGKKFLSKLSQPATFFKRQKRRKTKFHNCKSNLLLATMTRNSFYTHYFSTLSGQIWKAIKDNSWQSPSPTRGGVPQQNVKLTQIVDDVSEIKCVWQQNWTLWQNICIGNKFMDRKMFGCTKCYLHEITQPQHSHAPEIRLGVLSLETWSMNNMNTLNALRVTAIFRLM